MLCLTFKCGNNEYAINSKEIIEVIPLIRLHSLPKTTKQFVGYINYKSEPIPVIDLSVFFGYLPAELLMSTRIMILNFERADGSEILFGVLVESISDIENFDEKEIKQPDINVEKHPLIHKIIVKKNRTINLITFRSLKTLQLET
jgi:chemotaxis-related protein WspB